MSVRTLSTALLALAATLALLAAACGDGGDSSTPLDGGTPVDGTPAEDGGPESIGEEVPPGGDAPTLSTASAEAAVGAEVEVDLQVTGFPEPGLGAWTLNVTYDPAVVSLTSCGEDREGTELSQVCNPEFAEGTLRIAGAAAQGLEGDTLLTTLTFTCEAAGTSALEIEPEVVADGTIGGPRPVDYALDAGEITCA